MGHAPGGRAATTDFSNDLESFVYLYCAFRDSMSSDEVSCLLFQTTAPTASQVHKNLKVLSGFGCVTRGSKYPQPPENISRVDNAMGGARLVFGYPRVSPELGTPVTLRSGTRI